MSGVIVHDDIEQGSEAWFKVRAGIPTASMFKELLRGPRGGEAKGRHDYLMKLAGERITGQPMASFRNANMDRGHEMEPEARRLYAFISGYALKRVGFIRNDELAAGASPDSLVIGEQRVLEIKTAQPNVLIEHILADEFPSEHKAQCQGNLLVGELDVIDICIYWPSMPRPFIKEAGRDEPFLKHLRGETARFNDELAAVVSKVRSYCDPTAPRAALADALRASLQVVA